MTKRIIAFLMACMIGGTAFAKPPVFMTKYESAKKVSNDLGMDILLVFSADWCKYCKMLKKDLSASVSEDELKDLIICTIDVDKNPKMKREYRYPQFLIQYFCQKIKLNQEERGITI